MRQSKLVVLPLDGYRELCLNAKKAAQSECDKLQDSIPSSTTDNSTASVADTVTEPPTPALPDSTSNNGGSSPQPPVGTTDSPVDGTTPPSIPSKPTTPASLDSTSKTSTHTGPVDSTPTRPTDTPTTVNDADKESSLGRPRAFYINIVRKALSSAYQRQGYAFLLKLKSYSDFSLTDDGTIQIKGIDLEPFNVTTLLRIAFLKFHQGEIPFELQEWLKNKEIQFPTSKIKLRPKFQPKYQLRTSTLAKTRED